MCSEIPTNFGGSIRAIRIFRSTLTMLLLVFQPNLYLCGGECVKKSAAVANARHVRDAGVCARNKTNEIIIDLLPSLVSREECLRARMCVFKFISALHATAKTAEADEAAAAEKKNMSNY